MTTPAISNFVPAAGGVSFFGNKIHLYAVFLRQTQNSCLYGGNRDDVSVPVYTSRIIGMIIGRRRVFS